MYKNILIPTDGSELATIAVEHGVDFAKKIGAKVTGVTVTEPFHVLSLAPTQLEYTRAEYKKDTQFRAEKVLSSRRRAGWRRGCHHLDVRGLVLRAARE